MWQESLIVLRSSVPNKDHKSVTNLIFPNNTHRWKRRPKETPAAASVAIFAVEATGARAYRYHANTPFDILIINLFESFPHGKGFMVIPKTSKNYRDISGKTAAFVGVR